MEYASAFGNFFITNAPNLVGFVLPLIVEYANRDIRNEYLRFLMELFICFLAAVILNWHKISLGSPDQAVTSTAILFIESESLFSLYFKNSWLRGKIQQLGKGSSGVETQATP